MGDENSITSAQAPHWRANGDGQAAKSSSFMIHPYLSSSREMVSEAGVRNSKDIVFNKRYFLASVYPLVPPIRRLQG
jgi:hypothetical protein